MFLVPFWGGLPARLRIEALPLNFDSYEFSVGLSWKTLFH